MAGAEEPATAGGRLPARTVLFWLFVALAVATALSLWLFLNTMGDCDRDGVADGRDPSVRCLQADGEARAFDGTHVRTVVYRAMAADLAAPVIAWLLLAGIGAKGRPERWFYFAAAIPAGLAAMAFVLLGLHAVGEL